MTATIMTVGEELLIGQVVDTNAAWLAQRLRWLGVRVRKMVTIGDRDEDIRLALTQEWPESDLFIITGGLGPTPDDLTREALARFFRRGLEHDSVLLNRLKESYAKRGREMPAACMRMALVPKGFVSLGNPAGAAPGLLYEDARSRMLVAMPGVPDEMKAIFAESIEPRIVMRGVEHPEVHRTLCTAGEPESALAAKLADLTEKYSIAFLPRPGQVRLRLTSSGVHADKNLDVLEVLIRTRIGACVFGIGSDTLEAALGKVLRERGYTIAVAESCTGGLVLDMLTNVPGSSDYVNGGVIAYSNAIKQHLLGVQADSLEREGAVSRAVAVEMAHGVREKLGADVGLSISGVAGPDGGTERKPVGTVWIGYADLDGAEARLVRLGKHRRSNKVQSAVLALDVARRKLSIM